MKKKEKHYTTSRSTKRAVAWTAGIGVFVLLIAIWVTAVIMSNGNTVSSPDETVEPNTAAEVEQVQRSVTGNTVDEDKIAALEQATALFNEASAEDSEVFMEAMESLDSDGLEAEAANGNLLAYIRFVDTFEESEERQVNAVQTVLTLAEVASQFAENDAIAPISDEAWSLVHVDSTTGVAYVPLEAFTGTQTGYSLTMVYVDDEWKLDPYSLLDSVTLAAMIQNNAGAVENPGDVGNIEEE